MSNNKCFNRDTYKQEIHYFCYTILHKVAACHVCVGVQEKLGILNSGVVYAVYDYEAHNSDELSFKEGDKLVVLRKGDEWEREWWWSRLNDQEGYIPRNLLGVCIVQSFISVNILYVT